MGGSFLDVGCAGVLVLSNLEFVPVVWEKNDVREFVVWFKISVLVDAAELEVVVALIFGLGFGEFCVLGVVVDSVALEEAD